jgi:hypothetical protein
MVQKLTLSEWAAEHYTHPPAMASLYSYAKSGRFCPPAKKEFGMWRVLPNAILVDTEIKQRKDDPPELLRILTDGQAKKA